MVKLTDTTDELAARLPFSYFSSRIYLDFLAYAFERNGERVVVTRDAVYPHEFPALFLPERPENWRHSSVTFATEDAKAAIRAAGIPILIDRPVGTEFFYRTADFINPTGSMKAKIARFAKGYDFRLTNAYDAGRVEEFYERWKAQRPRGSMTFDESERFFTFCLRNLDAYAIRQAYVEIDGKLAGLAWGMVAPRGGWVGLHLKVDYRYKGLSRFLHRERARLFEEHEEFTLGTGGFEAGIEAYKRELRPCREVAYSYVLTGSDEDR